MAEKKYYWLKMTDQFFEDKAIKKLRKIAGGDTYTIIYLKMLLTAIKQGNKMYFEGIEDDFMEELVMEREQFKVLVKAMKAVYAQPTFIPDQDAFNVWFALLGDLPYKQAELAVQKHMATEKFPPTIADIREKAEQITSVKETEMSELEAWAIVRKAIGRSNYYAEEEFEKLPEACKMAVGNPSNLREWAMMDSDQVGTVEQSHFVRNYRTAMQRIKEDRRMPEKVRTAIAEVKKQQMQIEDRQEKPKLPVQEEKEDEIQGEMSEETRRKLEELRGKIGSRRR